MTVWEPCVPPVGRSLPYHVPQRRTYPIMLPGETTRFWHVGTLRGEPSKSMRDSKKDASLPAACRKTIWVLVSDRKGDIISIIEVRHGHIRQGAGPSPNLLRHLGMWPIKMEQPQKRGQKLGLRVPPRYRSPMAQKLPSCESKTDKGAPLR